MRPRHAVMVAAIGCAAALAARATEGFAHGATARASRPVAASPDSTRRTTLDGVYSAEQASRGKDTYLAQCQSCHAAITHTGPVFRRNWSGRTLSELFTFMSTRMPKSEPGSLAPETYADLLAYMLQMNKMPPGTAEIVPDPAQLARVRIQLAPPPRRAKR
ncbi:MAG: cytochrome c [Gemmatimonadetes bacterium]|nr:cytochrome c [Gemmatimonadota bacterium]